LIGLSNTILEMTAKGADLRQTIDRLCVEIERLAPGVVCSVLTVDDDGLLRPLSAPSLPDAYSQGLDGVAIGPDVGSCGSAAWSAKPVFVRDIAADPRWDQFRDAALPLGLRSCWSTPMLSEEGHVIGTFALYAREIRDPTDEERAIVDLCVHLCSIAIERHNRVEERERRAMADELTGLGNRAAFNEMLRRLRCDQPGTWAILMVDLDNLKVVNDGLGHHAGDLLIQVAAQRAAVAVAPDRVFRIGGDEFAILVERGDALRDIEAFAATILAAFEAPHDCHGQAIAPKATIGGAILASGDLVAETVRRNADVALYHGKETGRGRFVRYWPGIDTRIVSRISAIREVDAALREGRVEAFYQPIVRFDTRRIVAMEALCRLRMHDKGVMAATAFCEATADIQIAGELTQRMLEIVARDMREWAGLGIPISVNVSLADFHGGGLEQQIAAAQALHGLSLDQLVIEITEGAWFARRDGSIAEAVTVLREKGVRIVLDDFGTGGGMLMSLLSLPIDMIKIDKVLIDGIVQHGAGAAVIGGLLHAARDLDIAVVAEGVESEAQAIELARMGCTLGQGYFFSRPLDRHAATALLSSDRIARTA
jgi:diguanylate cyclase (GGDEF)-like protein